MLEDLIKYHHQSGIYCIYNKLDGKRYIGSAKDIYHRLHHHVSELNKNKHHNIFLQRAWNLYKEENFGYFVIEIVYDLSQLRNIEQIYIDSLFCCDDRFGYNLRPKADSSEVSEETKRKISEALKGRTYSQEYKDKMSESLKGRIMTEEHKKKIGEAHKANNRDEAKIKLIVELYQNNVKCDDIEKQVGVSRPTIRKILKEQGIFGRSKSFKGSTGENHGNSKPKATCVGCGKILSKRKYTRCTKCAGEVYERKN